MIITKKASPARTVLRGLGATLALPLLDGMVPALTAPARHGREADEPPRRGLRAERGRHGELDAGGRGRRVRVHADSAAACAVSGSPARAERARQQARGGAAGRTCGRAWAHRRRVPDRRAREADRRRRLRGGHFDRSDRGDGSSVSRRSSRRSSSASRPPSSRAPATPASAAPTPTRSPGAVRRRRCRWRTTRARCSSGCSATATAPIRPRGSPASGRTAASSTR